MIQVNVSCLLLCTSHGRMMLTVIFTATMRLKGTEPVACVSPPLFPIVTHHLMKSFSHHLQYSSLIFSVLPGKTKAGVKYKGTVEVPNLSDENDMEDLDVSIRQQTHFSTERPRKKIVTPVARGLFSQISISLNKEEPETPLLALMRTKGADKIRQTLGSYVGLMKTGTFPQRLLPF